jgi:hypothetical protein
MPRGGDTILPLARGMGAVCDSKDSHTGDTNGREEGTINFGATVRVFLEFALSLS